MKKRFCIAEKDYELLYQIIASQKGRNPLWKPMRSVKCSAIGIERRTCRSGDFPLTAIPATFFGWRKGHRWQTTSGYSTFAIPIAFIYARSVFLWRRRVH